MAGRIRRWILLMHHSFPSVAETLTHLNPFAELLSCVFSFDAWRCTDNQLAGRTCRSRAVRRRRGWSVAKQRQRTHGVSLLSFFCLFFSINFLSHVALLRPVFPASNSLPFRSVLTCFHYVFVPCFQRPALSGPSFFSVHLFHHGSSSYLL